MVEFFKTVGVGAAIVPLAISIVVVAAGLTALWAPTSKRQVRAIQVLKIVLRTELTRPAGRRRPQIFPEKVDPAKLPPAPDCEEPVRTRRREPRAVRRRQDPE